MREVIVICKTMEERIDALFVNGRQYIALEEGPVFNFSWLPVVVRQVIGMYDEGVSLWDMAGELERDPDEVAVLLMDLRRRRVIRDRPGGFRGWRVKQKRGVSA